MESLLNDLPEAVSREAVFAQKALTSLVNAARNAVKNGVSQTDVDQMAIHWTPKMGADELAGQVFARAREAAADAAEIQYGYAYCYHCLQTNCRHARPPEEGFVFSGYDHSGRPVWTEFFSHLQAANDPRAERLFARPPSVVTLMTGRNELIKDQLPVFGKFAATYRVIGQVCAGYFIVTGKKHALTFQAVETRGGEIFTNLLCDPELEAALTESRSPTAPLLRVRQALNKTALSLKTLNIGKARTDRRRDSRVWQLMKHLAGSIEQKDRQQKRRSGHAELRAAQSRPVHKARADLTAAAAEDFYADSVHHSIVVVGKNSRAHAYSHEGCHITSLSIGADMIHRRKQRNRYVPLGDSERREFLARVERYYGESASGS